MLAKIAGTSLTLANPIWGHPLMLAEGTLITMRCLAEDGIDLPTSMCYASAMVELLCGFTQIRNFIMVYYVVRTQFLQHFGFSALLVVATTFTPADIVLCRPARELSHYSTFTDLKRIKAILAYDGPLFHGFMGHRSKMMHARTFEPG